MKQNLLKKAWLLILAIFVVTQVSGSVLQQHFDENTPAYAGSSGVTAPDGWKYSNFSATKSTVYYGDVAGSMSACWSQSYVLTPEKAGGVGWVTFFYKPAYSQYGSPFNLVVQISTTGETFTDAATIIVDPTVDKGFQQASVIVNDADAKYVRLLYDASSSCPGTLWIDEITISDAVSGGAPATISVNAPNNWTSEVGTKITANGVTVSGENLTSYVSVAVEGSVFSTNKTTLSPAGGRLVDEPLSVTFNPTQGYVNAGFLKISGGWLPEMVFRLEGIGIARSINEGFNRAFEGSGSFNYYGWDVKTDAYWEQYSNIFEGAGAIKFSGSLTSPEKAGGIGDISFMYRSENTDRPVSFEVLVSSDLNAWTNVGSVSGAPTEYNRFFATVNNAAAKYVKIQVTSGGDGKYNTVLLADAFQITENGVALPNVSVDNGKYIGETATVPYLFIIPLNFSGISDAVTIAFEDGQLTSTVTTIPFAETTGAYSFPVSLPVTFTPAGGKQFVVTNLVVTGGGLAYPVKIPVQIFVLQESLYTDFETDWNQSSTTKDHITADGWTIQKGKRDNYDTAFGSSGSAYLNTGGALISPPVKSGMGDVQFYAKVSGAVDKFTLFVSTDGANWTQAVQQPASEPGKWALYHFTVENQTAKYLKIEYGGVIVMDEVKVTSYGQRIASIDLVDFTTFEIATAQAETLRLKGSGFSSSINLRFAKGDAFTIDGSSTISAADINDIKTYSLPIRFTPIAGSYAMDTLFIEGADLARPRTFVIDGYILRDMVHEGFNTNWVQTTSTSDFLVNGWTLSKGGTQTYAGSDLYEGAASVILNGGGKLLSVPKSGGVGTLAFYYHSGWVMNPIPVKVVTYKELGGEATTVFETEIPSETPYTYIEVPINNPDAKYIEFQNASDWSTIWIDLVSITANGVSIPKVIAPASVFVSAKKGETGSKKFNLTFEHVKGEVNFVLDSSIPEKVAPIYIDKTSVTLTGGSETVELTVTYSPANEEAAMRSLLIKGEGLLNGVPVNLIGTVEQDNLVQDFESSAWTATTVGSYVLDGWEIYNGKGKQWSWDSAPQGNNFLELSVDNTKAGYIISPAKSKDVNTVKFYYKSNTDNLKVAIETSTDRETWTTVDTLVNVSIPWNADYTYRVYQKKIADKTAKYVRLQTVKTTNTWASTIVIDSISITNQITDGIVKPVTNVKTYFAGDVLHVVGAQTGETVSVISVSGQLLYQTSVRSNNETLTPLLPKGIYVVKVGNAVSKLLR